MSLSLSSFQKKVGSWSRMSGTLVERGNMERDKQAECYTPKKPGDRMTCLWAKDFQSFWKGSSLLLPLRTFIFTFYLQTEYPQMKQTRTQGGYSVLSHSTKERRNFTLCSEHKILCSLVTFSWRRACLTKASVSDRVQRGRSEAPGEFWPCLFILRHTCAISIVVKGLWIRNTNKADCGQGPGWSSLVQLSWRAILHSLLYDNHSSFLCIELCSQKGK